MENITTRAEFNSRLKAIKRFGAKTAVKNKVNKQLNISVWELKERIRQEKVTLKREQRAREEVMESPVTKRGKSTGKTRAEMGTVKEHPERHRQLDDVEHMTQEEWDTATRGIDEKLHRSYSYEAAKRMQSNYIKGLIRAGHPADLIEMLQKIDPRTFARVLDTEIYATFDFIYDPAELKGVTEKIRDAWIDAVGENYVFTDAEVGDIANDVVTESEQGYRGRHYMSEKEWRAWEYENWNERRKPRRKKRNKK